jgi:hypothetical protein
MEKQKAAINQEVIRLRLTSPHLENKRFAMTTFNSSRVVIGFSAIALSMSVTASADQGRKSADLLSTSEVNELVVTATTQADHAKLQKHYLALAVKYDVAADKHAASALVDRQHPDRGSHFPGNATRRAEHCEGLAASNREAANQARELASEHERVAIAATRADHVTLRTYFLGVAAKFDAESARHSDMASAYRKNWNTGSHVPGSASLRARHCERLAASFRETANNARERAFEQERLIVSR